MKPFKHCSYNNLPFEIATYRKAFVADMELTGDQPLTLFGGTFFDWSRVWGFTSRESIQLFLDSLSGT